MHEKQALIRLKCEILIATANSISYSVYQPYVHGEP